VKKLQNWEFIRIGVDRYKAPEQMSDTLRGLVYGHPLHPDGTCVRTTPIVQVNGLEVTTRSGSVYRLGRIHPRYRHWLKAKGLDYDRANPLGVGQ